MTALQRTPTPAPAQWLSTNQAAALLGCHAQTVRDRCARGELRFERDAASGHRRVCADDVAQAAAAARSLGRTPASGARVDAGRPSSFVASLVADVEGSVSDDLLQRLAAAVREEVAGLISEAAGDATRQPTREAELRAALAELAACPWWRRGKTAAGFRARGLID